MLVTKVGSEMSPEDKGLSKQHIYKGVEDSLRRLQTDHIDLYFAHRDDPAAPLEETLEAFTHLVEQGKVRYIGASNYTAERLAEASQISKVRGCSQYVCLQPPYNLAKRDVYEGALEEYLQSRGFGCHNLLVAGKWISYWKVSTGAGDAKERTRNRSRAQLHE